MVIEAMMLMISLKDVCKMFLVNLYFLLFFRNKYIFYKSKKVFLILTIKAYSITKNINMNYFITCFVYNKNNTLENI